METIYIFIICLFSSLTLSAQQESETEDKISQANLSDRSRESFMNDANAMSSISNNGAFYVSNPSPTYKIEVEKAYHNPAWQDGEVRMINGDFYKAKLRYRVIDQAFEVLHKGEAYELKQNQLQGVYMGGDKFILMPDPLLKKRGVKIYQLHYNTPQYQLVEYHGAQWQDPPEQNMFDTREQHRTIKPMKELIFRSADGFAAISNKNDLLRILALDKKSMEARHAKRNNLKLDKAADIISFLEYLEGKD